MTTCDTIKESLKEKYSLVGLDEFLTFEPAANDVKRIAIYINIKDSGEHIGNVILTVTGRYIEIGMLERFELYPEDRAHKGLIRKVVKLVICRAVELGLPVNLLAVPTAGKNLGAEPNRNRRKLYKYYNNLGFTRSVHNNKTVNNSSKSRISYNTNLPTLKKIIESWNSPSASASASASAEGGGGGGGSRKRKTRRKS
jgi:hypothetical protein